MLRKNKIFVITNDNDKFNLYESNDIPRNLDAMYLDRIREVFCNGIVENKEYCVIDKIIKFNKSLLDLTKITSDIRKQQYNNIFFINFSDSNIPIIVSNNGVDNHIFDFVKIDDKVIILRKSIMYFELCAISKEYKSRDKSLYYLNNITEKIRS